MFILDFFILNRRINNLKSEIVFLKQGIKHNKTAMELIIREINRKQDKSSGD